MSTAKRLEATIDERPVTELGLAVLSAIVTMMSAFGFVHEIVYAGPALTPLDVGFIVMFGALALTFGALTVFFGALADEFERDRRAEA